MRIGLIRHFPVEQAFPAGWLTAAELQAWRERYDLATPAPGAFNLGGVAWRACVASDLPRARVTASAVFPGEVEYTSLLREPLFDRYDLGALRLPFAAWRWLLRLSWWTGHASQRACRDEFRQRVRALADRFESVAEDTLVVSHAGMMAFLGAELRRRGFAGPSLREAEHAKTYVYERP